MLRSTVADSVEPGFFVRHRFLLVFAALSSLMGTSVGIARVTTSLYAVELGAEARVLGLIAASQSVGILVVSMPIGVLVDLYGPRLPFMLGSLCAGLVYALIPALHSAWYLLASTCAISFFMPMRFVSLNTVFMRELERIGVGKAGWYRGTHMVGMMLLGPTIAVSTTRFFGFDGTYWLIAGLFALTIALCPIVFARYGEKRGMQGGAGQRGLGVAELSSRFRLLLGDRTLLRTCAVEFVAQSVSQFFGFFIIVIAVRSMHFSETQATELVSLEGGSFMCALFFFGTLVERFGTRRALRMAALVGMVALSLLGLASALWALALGGLLLGFALGTLQITTLTRFAALGAKLGRGQVSGITPLVGTCGSLLGSLLGGALGPVVGLQRVFLAFTPALIALYVWSSAQDERLDLPSP
jgi:MFS family permease